ncbi:AAA family ATPase [bacterium]|nr:AAA family ATPase [bacterium]
MIRTPLQGSVEELPDDKLVPFLREIAARFLSRQGNVFLLTGSVTDMVDGLGVVCPLIEAGSPKRFCYIDRYMATRLESRGRFVITYNIARGVTFTSPEQYAKLRTFYSQHDANGPVESTREQGNRGMRFDRAIAESQVYSFVTLRFLEELCRLARMHPSAGVANLTILIKHSETMIPDAPLAQLADIDRQKLTLLTEWFTDPAFCDSNEQVILISATSAAIHEQIRRLPQVSQIPVPLPDRAQRLAFIEWMHSQKGGAVKLGRTTEELAELTAGMTLLTLQNLFLKAAHSADTLDEKDILESLNRLLQSELGDKIEMVRPAHSMADVIGASALKRELARIKALLDTRDPEVAPVGILVAGPNGVGKTFVFEAWASECDRLVIVLKNLRSMYFGQTDQIFEKLRHVLEALGNVIIFIDEADTVFGRPGPNTHETESRLFGNLIKMMGEPRNRGRIVWILLTARPDNLAPDLKRSGRAGLHLPVFDPEGQDRRDYIDTILRRAGLDPATLGAEDRANIETQTASLSPADFKEVLVELRAERALTGTLTVAQVGEVLGNILPGQIAAQRRIQTLNAFLECSRKSLIPPSLAGLSRADAERELEQLRADLR